MFPVYKLPVTLNRLQKVSAPVFSNKTYKGLFLPYKAVVLYARLCLNNSSKTLDILTLSDLNHKLNIAVKYILFQKQQNV